MGGVFCYQGSAKAISASGMQVATTYYGGEYSNGWVVDNYYQCKRVLAGQISLTSIGATAINSAARLSNNPNECADDPGVGYKDDTPLHNRVSFAELSNDYKDPDYAALGNLPEGTKLLIIYKGRCVVAEKLDVGNGGPGLNGYPRALDLWWQTARALHFTSGFDITKIKPVQRGTPLTKLGQSYPCDTDGKAINSPPQPAVSNPTSENTIVNKKKSNKTTKAKKASIASASSQTVLGVETLATPNTGYEAVPIQRYGHVGWLATTLLVMLTTPLLLYRIHR